MKILDKANIVWGAIATLGATIFGQYWFLFLGFLVLNIVDYATGFIKAKFYEKNESSAIGAKGVAKKVMYWLVIGISFFIAFTFQEMGTLFNFDLSFVILFGWFTLASYMINELRSILENCVVMGVNVPTYLIKGLDVAEKMISTKTAEKGE